MNPAPHTRLLRICLLSAISAFSAVNLPASAADAPKVTYADHVLPLLRDKCVGCHNAEKGKGGLDVSTYFKLMAGGSSGEVVKPGDADGSRLYLLASHKEEPKMPPTGGKLGDDA